MYTSLSNYKEANTLDMRTALIQDWVEEGYSVDDMVFRLRANNIPTANKTVRKILHSLGYTYDNSEKAWARTSKPTPIDLSDKRVQPLKPITEPIVIEQPNILPSTQTLLSMLDISPSELQALKEVARKQLSNPTTVESSNIHDSISKLKFTDRANKTFYVSREVSLKATEFSEKHTIKLSHLIELALLEVMERYK